MRGWMRAFLVSAAGFLISSLCFAQTKPDSRPVSVGVNEVRDHLAGGPALIRVSLPERESGMLAMEGIAVRMTVDANGAVISAAADKSDNDVSADLLSRAESAAKGVRYRPFERDGHPVAVTFEDRVMVLPPELVPKKRIAFPQIHNWESLRITLRRTSCLGTCPSYRVEIHGDGTILYEGQAYVAITGSHRGSIPKETIAELVEAFRAADYFSLQDEYVWPATDLPTYETSIEIDGKLKKVRDYAGEVIGMPLSVSKLEAEFDRLADTERWTKGDENTVRSLEEEKWDFKSPEAAKTLARIAQSGSAEVVEGLIAGGVPLDVDNEASATALSRAAYRGDLTMIHVLLQAGVGKNTQALDGAVVMAATGGKADAVRLLIASGASPSPSDPSGGALLRAAAGSGVPAVVEQVLSLSTDVNARDPHGRTALMEAVGENRRAIETQAANRKEVVRMLLEAGADPNLQDERGNTALIECAWDADVAGVLIKHGANINLQNHDGITPLINAVEPDVARVLIQNGADLSLRDKDGKTALDEAKAWNRSSKAFVIQTAAQAHNQ